MGTNYYLHVGEDKKCHACGGLTTQVRKFHLGKSSAGWTFIFRGYKIGSLSPTGKPILSAADWKEAMKQASPCLIFDEDGQPIGQAEFWALVERKRLPLMHSGQLKNPFVHAAQRVGDRDWLDSEGNSFSDVEFS